jgi:hypothetical protein
MDKKYVVSKFNTAKNIKVPEATEILYQYGIVNSVSDERKTRELITKGRLEAGKAAGANPHDRRSPYLTSQNAIYKLIVQEIPIMKDIFEELEKNAATKTTKSKKVKSTNAEEKKQETQKK